MEKATQVFSSRELKNSFSSHLRNYQGHILWVAHLQQMNEGASVMYYSGHGTGGSGISAQYVQTEHSEYPEQIWWDGWRGYMYDNWKTPRDGGFTWYNPEPANLYDIIHYKWVDQLMENLHSQATFYMSCTTWDGDGPMHADNALGTTGDPELPSFSEVIHGKHSELGLPATTETCYKCHPGPNTQCFRDVMSQITNPMITCENCHGTLQMIAQSISNGRQPWLEEPKCGDVLCHGSQYAEQPGKLFRESQGHGNLLCSACHSSPHAILPSREANDNLQNIVLQGFAGTLQVCSVCHGDNPTSGGPHQGTTLFFQLSVSVSNSWNIVSVPGLNSPDQNVNTWWAYRDQAASVFKYSGGYQAVTVVTPGTG